MGIDPTKLSRALRAKFRSPANLLKQLGLDQNAINEAGERQVDGKLFDQIMKILAGAQVDPETMARVEEALELKMPLHGLGRDTEGAKSDLPADHVGGRWLMGKDAEKIRTDLEGYLRDHHGMNEDEAREACNEMLGMVGQDSTMRRTSADETEKELRDLDLPRDLGSRTEARMASDKSPRSRVDFSSRAMQAFERDFPGAASIRTL